MAMKTPEANKDVPIESAFKHLLVENGKLKSEIQYLENELANKNKAIEAFKAWQKKAVLFNLEDWYNKGMALLKREGTEEELQLREKYKVLKSFKDSQKALLNKFKGLDNEIAKLLRHLERQSEAEKELLKIAEENE